MKEYTKFNFNNEEYILITNFEFNNKEVYYFANEQNNILCIKSDDKYIPIEDENEIEEAKSILGIDENSDITFYLLNLSEYSLIIGYALTIFYISKFRVNKFKRVAPNKFSKKISEDERKKILEFTRDNLMKIKENETEIDVDEVYDRIKDVNIEVSSWNEEKNNVAGFFLHPRGNSGKSDKIVYSLKTLKREEKEKQRIEFHEILHKCTYSKNKKLINSWSGFMEGATENLVDKVYKEFNPQDSIIDINITKNGTIYSTVTPANCSYRNSVSIVRQIEYLIGESSTKTVVNGSEEFFDKIREKYGNAFLTYILRTTDLLSHGNFEFEKSVQIINDAQSTILNDAFDHDFERIKTPNDAKLYLKRLHDFKKYRIEINKYRDHKLIEEDPFKMYYLDKKDKIIDFLKNENISEKEIEESISSIEERTKAKSNNEEWIKSQITRSMIIDSIERKKSINICNYKLYSTEYENGDYYQVVVNENNMICGEVNSIENYRNIGIKNGEPIKFNVKEKQMIIPGFPERNKIAEEFQYPGTIDELKDRIKAEYPQMKKSYDEFHSLKNIARRKSHTIVMSWKKKINEYTNSNLSITRKLFDKTRGKNIDER